MARRIGKDDRKPGAVKIGESVLMWDLLWREKVIIFMSRLEAPCVWGLIINLLKSLYLVIIF